MRAAMAQTAEITVKYTGAFAASEIWSFNARPVTPRGDVKFRMDNFSSQKAERKHRMRTT